MVALGCDHAGFELKEKIIEYFNLKGIAYKDYGCYDNSAVDYPIYAVKVAHSVADGENGCGILCCGTGIGISIAANKVKGIRAACCSDEFTAEMTRTHNDANILCLGGRVISVEKALKLVDIFLNTPAASEERHLRRQQMLKDIEDGKM